LFVVSLEGKKLLTQSKPRSIGELIATSFANIFVKLRHVHTKHIRALSYVVRHYGYVDDCLTLVKGVGDIVGHAKPELKNCMSGFDWTHESSNCKQRLLDANIHIDNNGGQVSLSFSMLRKPNFRLHYLNIFSNHPVACKSGIFAGEAKRALVLCLREQHYRHCIERLTESVDKSGFPKELSKAPLHPTAAREQFLHGKAKERTKSQKLYLVLPFSRGVSRA